MTSLDDPLFEPRQYTTSIAHVAADVTLTVNQHAHTTVAAVISMTDENLYPHGSRLKSDVTHIRSDVGDIQTDLRPVRGEMVSEFQSLRSEMRSGLRAMQCESANRFRSLAGFLIVMSRALLTAILRIAQRSPSLPTACSTQGCPESVRIRPHRTAIRKTP